MPTSAPGRTEAGVTLVELLVVMLIIGMAAGMVLFAIPNEPSALGQISQQLERDVAALRDQAVAESAHYAVDISPEGYGIYRAEEGQWVLLAARAVPSVVGFELTSQEAFALPEHREDILLGLPFTEEDEGAFDPEIHFAPDGSVTPFAVKLGQGRLKTVISVDAFGRIVEVDDA
ncbi:prepilin-type N-terminal cleavage/methylation domain-containing protein [Parvularcula sp. ZS-1/3]|uniref:Prepilin-type N-terminal cleavage/methylation domain-containing protein n=1 Tax=Parvularcula mediterranea TaxID=2732508 RepID=A0A7Y3W5Y7_9PROT|nr:prepilin-type N-terminal cleavage/methylation domain-containing protein [Parvularcula mediterranea]NNU17109.1 prepilin-type N-terminal cleavage/methylation domain-containing protein [Parvularcula mediterranea]